MDRAPGGPRLTIAAHNGAPEWGGAEIATSSLLAGLQERGHHVVLFYNREVVARGARGYGLQLRRAHLGGDIAVHHAIRLAYRLRRLKPDVLVVGTFRKLWLAGLAARLAGVPVVARIGLSSDVPRSGKYELAFRHLVDLVITNANDLRDEYHRLLPDAPPPDVTTIHKGVDVPNVAVGREAVRAELGLDPAAMVVAGVGRLVSQKRYDRLIQAFALLPRVPAAGASGGSGRRTELLIVGDGPLRGSLESLAADLGVADRVHFAGHRDDVAPIMAAVDLVVVSSDRESLANVMLEAMAVGVPVLSTPVSGALEALGADIGAGSGEDGAGDPEAADDRVAAGRVVDSTAEALAVAMAELLADPATLRRMGEAGRRRVARHFDRERMLDAWERELWRVSGSGGGGGEAGGNGEPRGDVQ